MAQTTDSGLYGTITDGWGKRFRLNKLGVRTKPIPKRNAAKWLRKPTKEELVETAEQNRTEEIKNPLILMADAPTDSPIPQPMLEKLDRDIQIAKTTGAVPAGFEVTLHPFADEPKRVGTRRKRPDVRIGKCMICRRRYGYVPTNEEAQASAPDQIRERNCDRHAV